MSNSKKDATKLRFLDKLFAEKPEPVLLNYTLMQDKEQTCTNECSKKFSPQMIAMGLLGTLLFIYVIFGNYTYGGIFKTMIWLIFVILVISLIIDYFYFKKIGHIYSEFKKTLLRNFNKKQKTDRDEEGDRDFNDNYKLFEI
jgi:hypothetical protein